MSAKGISCKLLKVIVLASVVLLFPACDKGDLVVDKPSYSISAAEKQSKTTTMGSLAADSLKWVHDLDFAFYPVDFLDSSKAGYLHSQMNSTEIERLVDLYPVGATDRFKIGTMKGSSIKKFLRNRSRTQFTKDLDVAGMSYSIFFHAGVVTTQAFAMEDGSAIDEDQYYRVAISNAFYFSGQAFPGYRYGNNLNFDFSEVETLVSLRSSLKEYLTGDYPWPKLYQARAEVRRYSEEYVGEKKIYEVQGAAHISPLWKKKVTVSGVVTAFAVNEWYPGGFDIYIQDLKGDGNPKTSDAVHVFYPPNKSLDLKVGDRITVTGTVYEQIFNQGLGRTSIREVTELKRDPSCVGSQCKELPAPVFLTTVQGGGGRIIPQAHISTYVGNLNLKPDLNLADGIDFWESLEGMRVKVRDIRIVGFRGGQENHPSAESPKGYLNLYFVTDSNINRALNKIPMARASSEGSSVDTFAVKDCLTGEIIKSVPLRDAGEGECVSLMGVFADVAKGDFNPEIMQLTKSHLTRAMESSWIFNVGDQVPGELSGVLGYEPNIFGDGEFALVFPLKSGAQSLYDFQNNVAANLELDPRKTTPLELRDKTTFITGEQAPSSTQLTVATYNVKNLNGGEIRGRKGGEGRLQIISKSIRVNLKCPDIVNLVEIQDDNGVDFAGGASAEKTLKNLIKNVRCENVEYEYVNIDPVLHSEGGMPGGNIRVSIIYNKHRVGFRPRLSANPLEETNVIRGGGITINPGRIYPNDKAFHGSRRSIVAEFTFRGQSIYIIGNHWNSKLGDTHHWHVEQPANIRSDVKRIPKAEKVHLFVERLLLANSKSNVIVLGDFNAHAEEMSMQVLKGDILKNLSEELLPMWDRYTTNHNGNSQSLDYIVVNGELMKRKPRLEVLHMNSNFMGRLSDHDPVIAIFDF